MASACATSCVQCIPPSVFTSCGLNFKKGSIDYAVFANCDVDGTLLAGGINPADNTVVAEVWNSALEAGKIRISPLISTGAKADITADEVQVSSCLAPVASQYTHVYNLTQTIRTISSKDVEFWNFITANQLYLRVGFLHCDNDEFTPFYPFTISMSDPFDGTNNSRQTLNATITILTPPQLIVPVQVVGLKNLLLGKASIDCISGGYASDTWAETAIEDLFA